MGKEGDHHMPESTGQDGVMDAPAPVETTVQAMDLRAVVARLHLSLAKDKMATQKSTERPVKEPKEPIPQRIKPVNGIDGSPFFENHLSVIGTEYEDDGHLSLPPLFRRSQTAPSLKTKATPAAKTELQDNV